MKMAAPETKCVCNPEVSKISVTPYSLAEEYWYVGETAASVYRGHITVTA
jgi:hypothetical protein